MKKSRLKGDVMAVCNCLIRGCEKREDMRNSW